MIKERRGIMKKIVCISASNIITAKGNSSSTKTCKIIKEMVEKNSKEFKVEIIDLIEYDLLPCNMCEKCIPSNKCQNNSSFNEINSIISNSDGIFIVCPHYAPIPSKLIILFEKLEEIFYLNYCINPDYKTPYLGKPVGIIGHGGMIDKYKDIYRSNLLIPISNVIKALGMDVVKLNNDYEGVLFGVEGFVKNPSNLAPRIEHNWEKIRKTIKPLVETLVERVNMEV